MLGRCGKPVLELQEVHGRTVTVLQHSGKVYAVDTSCFHQGGPLGTQGDIEDIDGVACIRCPWHGYRVSNRSYPRFDLTFQRRTICILHLCFSSTLLLEGMSRQT
jgi:hypothetical protein